MLQSLLRALSAAAVCAVMYCAVIGGPIAMLLLLAAPHVRWWGETLGKHTWLVIVLVAIIASHFVVGGVLYESSRRYQRFLLSPEGKRRRAEEVQKSITAIIAEAKAKPRLKLDEGAFEGMSAASVMTEARRLARNSAKDELRRRGVRLPWEVDASELTRIADALLATDLNFIGTAKGKLEERTSIRCSRSNA